MWVHSEVVNYGMQREEQGEVFAGEAEGVVEDFGTEV